MLSFQIYKQQKSANKSQYFYCNLFTLYVKVLFYKNKKLKFYR